MINKIFEDTFNVFVNTLNVINAHKKSRVGSNGYIPDSLKRITDSITFILKKQDVFELDLEAVKSELVQIKKEIGNLQKEKKTSQTQTVLDFFVNFTYLFSVLEGLVEGLILEVEKEIDRRAKKTAEAEEAIKKVMLEREEVAKRFFEREKALKDKKEREYSPAVNNNILPKKQKIKVFKSAFAKDIEKEMNDFLEKNNIEVVNILQNIDKEVVVLTIIYKEL